MIFIIGFVSVTCVVEIRDDLGLICCFFLKGLRSSYNLMQHLGMRWSMSQGNEWTSMSLASLSFHVKCRLLWQMFE